MAEQSPSRRLYRLAIDRAPQLQRMQNEYFIAIGEIRAELLSFAPKSNLFCELENSSPFPSKLNCILGAKFSSFAGETRFDGYSGGWRGLSLEQLRFEAFELRTLLMRANQLIVQVRLEF